MSDDDDFDPHLKARYPVPGDPRRDPDFGSRRPDYEQRQILLAILDTLYRIERAADRNAGKSPEVQP